MSEAKTIIRTQKDRNNPYVMVNKGVFNDTRLGWKAKGLMGYLLSKPDDWRVMVQDLIKASRDGKASVYTALNELKEYGYLQHDAVRDDKGRIAYWEYVVFETPDTENRNVEPDTENQDLDNQDLENPDVENLEIENRTLLINDSTNTDQTNYRFNRQGIVVDQVLISSEIQNALKIKVPEAELKTWIIKYGEAYIRDKLIVATSTETNTPLRTLRAAIRDNWATNEEIQASQAEVSATENPPMVQPQLGKYERFYELYKNRKG